MDLRERKKQSANRTKRQNDDDTSPKTCKRVEKPHSLTKWLLIVCIIFIKFALAAKIFPYLKFSEPLNTEYLKYVEPSELLWGVLLGNFARRQKLLVFVHL